MPYALGRMGPMGLLSIICLLVIPKKYHAVVLTLIKSIVCLDFLKGGFLSRGDDVLALAFLL